MGRTQDNKNHAVPFHKKPIVLRKNSMAPKRAVVRLPMNFSIRCGQDGAALVTTLLLLVLMSLSGFMLLQFATIDIRLSGNDRLSRMLLYRVESCALYGAQTLLNLEKELLLPGNPERPSWIHDAAGILQSSDLGLTDKNDLSGLSDREVLQLMDRMTKRDLLSTQKEMIVLDDKKRFPFLEGGRGTILVIDCGHTDAGSQDVGGSTFRKYILLTEYKGQNDQRRLLEMGLVRKI